MMKRYKWLVWISLGVVASIILNSQLNTPAVNNTSAASISGMSSGGKNKTITAPVVMADNTDEKNPAEKISATITNNSEQSPASLWSTESVTTSVAIPEGVSSSQTVSLNRQGLQSLQVGSKILLPTPTGEFAEARIERISYDALGNRLLEGSIISDNTPQPVTITDSKNMTLATFTTESGEYALESRPVADCKDSAGECISTGRVWQIPPLDQIIKPGSTDMVIPEENH